MLFRPLHPVPTLSVRSFVRQSGLFASLSIDKEREREEGGGNDQLRPSEAALFSFFFAAFNALMIVFHFIDYSASVSQSVSQSKLEDPANDHLSEIRILPIRIWNVFANEEKLLTKASFSSRLRGE